MIQNKKQAIAPEINKRTLHRNLSFTGAEQYKLMRTNLSFTLPEEETCPIIGVTSSVRGEGKSTTAINLAFALGETGKRVVLIDGDLRLPSVAKKMGIPGAPGLTNLLLGQESVHISRFQSSLLDNWYIIPSGALPPNPSELLSSKKMDRLLQALREQFDYVILDLPPVNVVSDGLAVTRLISGMILVVREDYTSKKELEMCVRQIRLSNIQVLGCVLNAARSKGGSYGKYKKYYHSYGYSHPSEAETEEGK